MNPANRELLRVALLTIMEQAGAYACPLPVLETRLRISGFPGLTRPEIEPELHYLRDKGFCQQERKPISPENSGWRITAPGRDHLATEGLA